MKRYIWPVLFSFLIVLSSCTAETCELRITTRVPDGISGFTYYSCVLTQDGHSTEAGSRDGTFRFPDSRPGRMKATVSAYSEGNSLECTGCTEFEVQMGLNEISIQLEPEDIRKKDIVLQFPDTDEKSLLTLSNELGMIIIKDVPMMKSRIDLEALSYGCYTVVIRKIHGNDEEKCTYSFRCSERTPEEIVFLESEKDDGSVLFDFFDITSSPIEGKIRVKENADTISLELVIQKRIPEMMEKDLEFQWYRNGVYAGSGEKLEIVKTDETIRYDCIMKSRYLGSYGSESICISISR